MTLQTNVIIGPIPLSSNILWMSLSLCKVSSVYRVWKRVKDHYPPLFFGGGGHYKHLYVVNLTSLIIWKPDFSHLALIHNSYHINEQRVKWNNFPIRPSPAKISASLPCLLSFVPSSDHKKNCFFSCLISLRSTVSWELKNSRWTFNKTALRVSIETCGCINSHAWCWSSCLSAYIAWNWKSLLPFLTNKLVVSQNVPSFCCIT